MEPFSDTIWVDSAPLPCDTLWVRADLLGLPLRRFGEPGPGGHALSSEVTLTLAVLVGFVILLCVLYRSGSHRVLRKP